MDDQDHVQDQEPPVAEADEAVEPSRLNRRGFLKLSSVSSAAAVLAACANQTVPKPSVATPATAATAAPTAAATTAATTAPTPAAVAPTAAPAAAASRPASDLLAYPRHKIAALSDLGSGVFNATYPDFNSQVVVLKLGTKTVGGVGPDGDIVAYSGVCTHMGCPTSYDPKTKIFACPCHYSHFDAAADAMLINGPATQHLPRITLEVDGQDIYAVGVHGLFYGRPNNLSLTEL